MKDFYVWTAAVLTVACGVPIVIAFFVRGARRSLSLRLFEAGAAAVGLVAPWLYLAWHGRRFGYRSAAFDDFRALVVALIVVSAVLHGAFAAWLGGRLARSGRRVTPLSGLDALRRSAGRVAARAAGLGGIVLAVWCGWLISDGMGYPGGLSAMLFPEASDSGVPVLPGVERGCVPFRTYGGVQWCPLAIGRFLVLAGSVLVSFVLIELIGGFVCRRRTAAGGARVR